MYVTRLGATLICVEPITLKDRNECSGVAKIPIEIEGITAFRIIPADFNTHDVFCIFYDLAR